MSSVRLSGECRGDHHDLEKSDPTSEIDEERWLQNLFDPSRENQIPTPTPTPTYHRTTLPDFVPKETRDRLRELVLNSPNPRKILNYFRSKFIPSCPRINESKKNPNSHRAIPARFEATYRIDDLTPCFNGEASSPRASPDDVRCDPEKLFSRIGAAVDVLHSSSGSAITKMIPLEEVEAKASLSVFSQAAVQEVTLNLQAVPSMAAMKALSATSDAHAEGEHADVRPGTTEILKDGHAPASPELPRRQWHRPWRRPFRDKVESLRAVCFGIMEHLSVGYSPPQGEGGAVGDNDGSEASNSNVSGMSSLPRSDVYAQPELVRVLQEEINKGNKPKWKKAGEARCDLPVADRKIKFIQDMRVQPVHFEDSRTWITLEDEITGEEVKVKICYERLPNFCLFCGFIGHMEARCDLPVADRKIKFSQDMRVQPVHFEDSRTWFLPDAMGQTHALQVHAAPWRASKPASTTAQQGMIAKVVEDVAKLNVNDNNEPAIADASDKSEAPVSLVPAVVGEAGEDNAAAGEELIKDATPIIDNTLPATVQVLPEKGELLIKLTPCTFDASSIERWKRMERGEPEVQRYTDTLSVPLEHREDKMAGKIRYREGEGEEEAEPVGKKGHFQFQKPMNSGTEAHKNVESDLLSMS
ncbi:hypothetical protein ACQ4PT_005988 [Festuca glaucescens]